MKLLFIVPNFPFRPLGGGSVRIYYLTKEWSQRHQVHLVAPVFEPVNSKQVTQYEQELQAHFHPVLVQPLTGWKHKTAYLQRTLKGAPPFLHYPELIHYLDELTKTLSFDVVYVEGSGFGGSIYFRPFVSQSPRPKFILTFLDVLWHWWKREFFHAPQLSSLLRWWIYRIWEPRFVQDTDCCVFMSPVDKEIVERVVQPRQAIIAAAGVDVNNFPATPVPNTKNIMFVGSFRHQPNLHAAYWLLQEIYPRIRERMPDVKLKVIGLAPPTELIQLASAVGAEVHADVPDTQPYYQEARVVVVPIQTGGGVRIKILEACAASRPIVTTTIGAEGLPLIPNQHALFADSTEEFVAALFKLIENDEMAKTLATNGRKLVEEQFTWSMIGRAIERGFIV